jgi:hypothetical protein
VVRLEAVLLEGEGDDGDVPRVVARELLPSVKEGVGVWRVWGKGERGKKKKASQGICMKKPDGRPYLEAADGVEEVLERVPRVLLHHGALLHLLPVRRVPPLWSVMGVGVGVVRNER